MFLLPVNNFKMIGMLLNVVHCQVQYLINYVATERVRGFIVIDISLSLKPCEYIVLQSYFVMYSIYIFIHDIDVTDLKNQSWKVIKLSLLLTRNIGEYFAYRSYRTITSFLAKLN